MSAFVSRRVADAMAATPRSDFLTLEHRAHASEDRPLPLFDGQTNSQPTTVAQMLDLLDVPVGAHVLDVGAGSGWTTAILAELTGPTGSVLGVERIADLAAWGAGNLAATRRGWASIQTATPGVLGAPERGPFDRILVSAMASTLPEPLVAQLAPSGVLVIPVNGRMWRITAPAAHAPDPPRMERFGAYRFVPLIID